MREHLDLIRDVLDKQIVDCDETRMGRVDGIVLAIEPGRQPRIDHLELGFSVLARRVHPRLEAWLQALRERWSVRRSARQFVRWAQVIDFTQHHLQLDVKLEETPAFDWERWLRRQVVDKIPGSGKE
jgi:hypothetical protein